MAIKVLVIDDSQVQQKIMAKFFEEEPRFSCSFASDGKEGLEKANETSYSFIVTDMEMPGWSGLETIEKIRQISKEGIKPYLMAYSSDSSFKEKCEKAKIPFLEKPISKAQLFEAMNKYLSH